MSPEAPTAQLPTDPPPPPEEPRKLTRSASDRVVTGVAGGLGRHLGVDPLLVRVGFVVLSVLGGAGILLYIVLALVVPGEHAGEGGDGRLATGAIVLLVLLGLVTVPIVGGGLLFFAPGLLVLALIAVVCVVVVRALRGEDASVGKILLALVAIAAAVALGLAAAAGVAFGGGTAVAIVVLGLGIALVVAGFVGGARWLVLPALAMAIPSVLVAASGLDLRGGVGSRDVRPAALADVRPDYRLGVGRLTVDLRSVQFAGTTDLKVSSGMGQIELIVPESVCVQTTARTSMGALDTFDRTTGGLDVGVDESPLAKAGQPTLRVDADVTVGHFVVSHEPYGQPRYYDRFDRDVRDTGTGADAQPKACVTG